MRRYHRQAHQPQNPCPWTNYRRRDHWLPLQ